MAVFAVPEAAAERDNSTNLGHEGAVVLPIVEELGAVTSEVGARVAWQEAARIEYVPQRRVEEHRGGLEDVEVPLISHNRAQSFEGLEVAEVDLGVAQVLNEAVDTSDEDERHAAVECYEDRSDWFGL